MGKTVKLRAGDLSAGLIEIANGRIKYKRNSVTLVGASARVEGAGDIDRRVTATRLILTGPLAFGLEKEEGQPRDVPNGRGRRRLVRRRGRQKPEGCARNSGKDQLDGVPSTLKSPGRPSAGGASGSSEPGVSS